jgi:hypothetical protein
MTFDRHSRTGTPLALAAGFFVLSVVFRLAGAAPDVALLGAACCISAAYALALSGEARRPKVRRAPVKIESRPRKPHDRQP